MITPRQREQQRARAQRLVRAYAMEIERIARINFSIRAIEVLERVFDVLGFAWVVFVLWALALRVFVGLVS